MIGITDEEKDTSRVVELDGVEHRVEAIEHGDSKQRDLERQIRKQSPPINSISPPAARPSGF